MIVELKTFTVVAACGTFAGAGQRLGLTQAAVSGQIRRLESHLGYPLFDRTGRSATLNADGAATLERARELILQFDALGTRNGMAPAGSFRVGAISSVQSTLLPRALTPFLDNFPSYRVHIVSGLSLHLLDKLDAGELDLSLMIRPSLALPPDFLFQSLVREPYRLVVPNAVESTDPIAVLADMPLIRYERGSFGGRQLDRFLRALKLPLREIIEIDDLPAMPVMVARGLGVAVVPMTESLLPLPQGVRTLSFGEMTPYREIGAISRRSAHSPVMECLLEHLLTAATRK